MKEKGITVLTNLQLVKAEKKKAYLSNGTSLDFDFLVLATGAAPPPLLSNCGLELDQYGFMKVVNSFL